MLLITTPPIVTASLLPMVFGRKANPPDVPVSSVLLSACVVVMVPPPTEKLAAKAGIVSALVPRQKAATRASAVIRNIACDMTPTPLPSAPLISEQPSEPQE